MKRARRRIGPRTFALYARSLLFTFRFTLGSLALAVAFGATLYAITPLPQFGGRPPLDSSLYASWMALFAQPITQPPEPWYLEAMAALFPLLGVVLIGEGIVRLSLLLLSRQHGEKDWMKVMASIQRDHVVLCGLGHLGSRVLFQLLEDGADVVVLEKDGEGRFLAEAKASGVAVLIRDMKEDQALLDAGVLHARCIIIATNDDIANIEVALDARRLNPEIRVVMRMFDQQIADKIKDAFAIDQAFSSAALAAPLVAAMSQQTGVLASFSIAGIAHLTVETLVQAESALLGKSVAEIEASHGLRVLARVPASGAAESPPSSSVKIAAGDRVVLHGATVKIAPLLQSAKASAA